MHTVHPGRPARTERARDDVGLAVLAAAAVVALLGWAVAVPWAPLLDVDRAVSGALYAGDDRSRWVEAVLQVATAPGLSVVRAVVLVPVVAWLLLRRAWWTAAWVVTAGALVGPLTTALKELVGRQRPQFADGGARYASLSFPSGHAAGIACLVTVLLVLGWPRLAASRRRVWLGAGLALVVLVGLTRLWLGVHFLSDVVGGWAFGAGWALLVAWVFGALPGGRAALR